jgi:hypothetical protein
MKILYGNTALVRMFFLVSGLILLFSCSTKEDDMRQRTVDELGPPDQIVSGGYGYDIYELYYYDNRDIDRVYQYRKSAPGCGSSGNWYIVNTYVGSYIGRTLYTPPTIVHSPVKSAPAGKSILIAAKVTDDLYVKDAIVHYRVLGDTTFLPLTMGLADSTNYTTDIPADKVTTAGLEYYIEAHDAAHVSRMPAVKGTYRISVSPGAAKILGKPETTFTPSASKLTPTNSKGLDITR